MTRTFVLATAALIAAGATVASTVAGTDAHARGKQYYSETYQFDRAMNGYEGFSGAYHCSFVKTPKKLCLSGKCKTVWELVQTCQ